MKRWIKPYFIKEASTMTRLDKESIHSKIARIRRNLSQLKKLGKIPYQKYVGDFLNTSTAERLLQVSIEAMLDIGSHIIAEEELGEPLEYRDVFSLLVKNKIIRKTSKEKLMQLASLRNRIVHVYEDIDHKLIHRYLQKELSDIEKFTKEIVLYLKKA